MVRRFRSDVSANALTKQPGENVKYSMEFTRILCDGEAITTVNAIVDELVGDTTPPGLTIGGGTIRAEVTASGTTRQFVDVFISGGTDGEKHRIEITVTTSTGNTRIGDGELLIRDR